MRRKFENPILYFTLGLIFIIFQFIGKGLDFLGFVGILFLFLISFYNLIINIKEKINRIGICFIISLLTLLISILISSSTFILLKNVGKDKIKEIEYTFEGNNIGTSGFTPIKSSKSVFKIRSLKSNDVTLVRINKYKYPKGILWIINKDTISRIVEFNSFSSLFSPCIINKNISTEIDFYNTK